jgi:hypothetical protein
LVIIAFGNDRFNLVEYNSVWPGAQDCILIMKDRRLLSSGKKKTPSAGGLNLKTGGIA